MQAHPLQDSGPSIGSPTRHRIPNTTWSATDQEDHSTPYEPPKFGDIADYWKFYDTMANAHDKGMVQRHSANLDVLLIFAGLFSAVNTAFIVLSLEDLSPDSDAQAVQLLTSLVRGEANTTNIPSAFSPSLNAIRVNCLLSASLACSLIAAFGAVMAKQWVLHYSQGIVGTMEHQARTRQKKLNGVEKYHLGRVVEVLPALLQISVFLFFVGFILYLYSINTTVSFVVLAFAAAGLAFHSVTLLMACVDPQCPFQIPFSVFLHQAMSHLHILALHFRADLQSFVERNRLSPSFTPSSGMAILLNLAWAVAGRVDEPLSTPLMDSKALSRLRKTGREQKTSSKRHAKEEQITATQTACWLLETSEHRDALLSAAKNIPCLARIKSTRLALGGTAFQRLLAAFRESLDACRSMPMLGRSQTLDEAQVFGRAICHSIIGSKCDGPYTPPEGLRWTFWGQTSSKRDANELLLIQICIEKKLPIGFCLNYPTEQVPRLITSLPIYLASLFEPSAESGRGYFRMKAFGVDRIALAQRLMHMCLSNAETQPPAVINLCAWALAKLPTLMVCAQYNADDSRLIRDLRRSWWNAYTSDVDFDLNLINALGSYSDYQQLSVTRRGASALVPVHPVLTAHAQFVDIYSLLIAKALPIISTKLRHAEVLNRSLFKLDVVVRYTLGVIASQSQSSETAASVPPELLQALQRLKTQLLNLLRQLHQIGTEWLVPNGSASSSGLPTNLAFALGAGREARYAALSWIHQYASTLSESESEDVGNGMDREVLSSLIRCFDHHESFELVSEIIIMLVDVGSIRSIMSDLKVLRAYGERAWDVLSEHPGFLRIDLYLRVRSSCKQYAQESPDLREFVWNSRVHSGLIEGCLRAINRRIRKVADEQEILPYASLAWTQYVEDLAQGQRLYGNRDDITITMQALITLTRYGLWGAVLSNQL